MEVPEFNPNAMEGSEMSSHPVWEDKLKTVAQNHPEGLTWGQLMREAFPGGNSRFAATQQRQRLLDEGSLLRIEKEDGEDVYVTPSLKTLKEQVRRRRSA